MEVVLTKSKKLGENTMPELMALKSLVLAKRGQVTIPSIEIHIERIGI